VVVDTGRDEKSPIILGRPFLCVAEPPESYGPHVHSIVFQTSDSCTCKLQNSGSLSGVLGRPESSTLFFRIGSITEDIAELHQFIQLIILHQR
jgi:hypothetical protein